MTSKSNKPLRIGIVVPHIFMQDAVLPHVIFSPAQLALNLADGLQGLGATVRLYTPGTVTTLADNVTADLSLFEQELAGRGDTYIELLKKHPATFIALARQVHSELIAKAFAAANNDELDIVHIYTNEEDIALPFVQFCKKPVVLSHHDPFNFLVRYKNNFPKYKRLNWVALSESQKKGMPADTNWIATIHHGLPANQLQPVKNPTNDYIAYLGRIIEPKGVHLAITAVQKHNQQSNTHIKLKIAGKHYHGYAKDTYWQDRIKPQFGPDIEYVGHIATDADKQEFLGNAKALIIPSIFEEPFGMVMIESLACGTPVIGLDSGAISEVIQDQVTGILVQKSAEQEDTVQALSDAINKVSNIDRKLCRSDFEKRFSIDRMCKEYLAAYQEVHTLHT